MVSNSNLVRRRPSSPAVQAVLLLFLVFNNATSVFSEIQFLKLSQLLFSQDDASFLFSSPAPKDQQDAGKALRDQSVFDTATDLFESNVVRHDSELRGKFVNLDCGTVPPITVIRLSALLAFVDSPSRE